MKNFTKGFTLIELLVVIAIIGILSSIVLASLSSARSKGEDSAIQTTLSNMRAQAELYYANNSNYGTTTTNIIQCPAGAATPVTNIFNFNGLGGLANLTKGLTDRQTAASTRCATNGTAWIAMSILKDTTKYFCVDSTGTAKSITGTPVAVNTAITATNIVCP